jgi:hypothetical protein
MGGDGAGGDSGFGWRRFINRGSLDRRSLERQSRLVDEVLREDRIVNGMALPKGTTIRWRGDERQLYQLVLAQPVRVSGMTLAGTVEFAAGVVSVATLANDQEVNGVFCKAGRVELGAGKQMGQQMRCTLGSDWQRGQTFQAGTELWIGDGGEVEMGTLAGDQMFEGQLCLGGTLVMRDADRVHFTVARDEVVRGIACKAGTKVSMSGSNGAVLEAVLARDQEVDGISCQGGRKLEMHYEGQRLNGCTLARAMAVKGVKLPMGTAVWSLMNEGSTWRAELPPGSELTLGPVKVVGDGHLMIDMKSGAIREVDFGMDPERGYAEFMGGRFVALSINEDGSGNARLTPGWGVMIDGVAHAPGSYLEFGPGARWRDPEH